MAAPRTPRGLQPNEPSWQMRVLDQYDTVGGAVLLSPGLLVTCAHVVNAALGLDGDKEEHPGALATVRLKSFDDREWEATVDTQLWSAGPDSRDLAVLRLRDAGPDTSFPVLRECASLEPQQPLYTAGYPEGMRSLQAPLVCQGPGGPTGLTHQVETPASQPVRITGGFSGCAVRTGTGELVGIMQKTHHYVWNDPDRPSGIAFVLPVEELVGERDGGDVVSAQRLADESLCGREAYDSLHDLLDSVSLEAVPPEGLLRPSETRRARRHDTGAGTTAWRVLTALWDLVPPAGEPPPRVVWVHHVHQEIRRRRPLPPAVWSWIRREASAMGRDWEEVLTRDRDRRLLGSRGPNAPATPLAQRSARPPGTVVTFELEPVTGGYRLLHSIDHRDERGELPQSTRLVGESEICDEIADLMGEATMQMLITPDEDSLRLSVRLPRELLHLSLGQASPHRDLVAFPPLLCTTYEIVYHVRERVTAPHYLGASERWRTRTMRQRARPLVEDRNVLTSWRQETKEVANVLSDLDLTVLVVDDESPDLRHVYDAALYQGVPTIIRGPKSAILPLLQELLDQEPDARVRISGLPRYLRDRARENSDSRKIAIIHDSFEDTLLRGAPGGTGAP
ncbi:trypsin-like peptidase domain-containing protein [Nocardiopsis sp. RV163]|uniref:trypsin-like peptidase domain-containing protein n=1 Tax=Nocardiopsis sp. RV163 TaxID=1661388 RepID=UPI000A440771|nr:trypsin-like peptidase domain-containing protein [Nocardiopsis sp. RV163]